MENDKRVGVAVFTNRKIKTTKSKTRQSDPESLSEKATSYIRSARLILGFVSVAAYGLSKKS